MTINVATVSGAMRSWRGHLILAAAVSVILSLVPGGAHAAVPDDLTARCEDLQSSEFVDATVTSATMVQGDVQVTPGRVARDMPEFCRVGLTVEPAIVVEVWLPTQWNDRLVGSIIGGWAGALNYGTMEAAVRESYAAVSTDTGHVAGSPDWMLDDQGDLDRGLVEDYAHRAAHEMTVKAKALALAYYGRETAFDYYRGCSGGGRQGVALAQLYPEDYDGILAEAPAMYLPQFLTSDLWPQLSRLEHAGLSSCQLQRLHEQVVATCDPLDGLEDGLIGDPRRCDFDPDSMTCMDGNDVCDCLSPEQVELVRDVFEGPTGEDGERLWYGFDHGSELYWGGIPLGPSPFGAAVEFFQYMVHRDMTWDWAQDFQPEADLELALNQVGDLLQTDDPDLRPFADAGGKLVMWHGWADQIIPATGSVQYMDLVHHELGQRTAADVARLFLAPGVPHCGGGNAPNVFDAFQAVVDWVEAGTAPDRIVATQLTSDGSTERTRPLCPYPLVASYDGSGSIDDADNFDCALTGPDRADYATGFGPGLEGRNRARRSSPLPD